MRLQHHPLHSDVEHSGIKCDRATQSTQDQRYGTVQHAVNQSDENCHAISHWPGAILHLFTRESMTPRPATTIRTITD